MEYHDIEIGTGASDVVLLEPGQVIPASIARPVVYASQLMLVVALFATWSREYDVTAMVLLLWFTSTNYWRDPRFGRGWVVLGQT